MFSTENCLGIGMLRTDSQDQIKKRWNNENYNYKRNKIT